MVTKSEVLDIIEIVFFAPALPISLYVCYKQGFGRDSGWILLTLLSLVRVVGAAIGIAATQNPTSDLITAALVLSSIGSTFLVAAFSGLVNRVETGAQQTRIPPRIRKLLQLVALVAVILGIVGGTKVSSSDPDNQADGYTYIKASAILILIMFLASMLILSASILHMRAVKAGDRKIFYASIIGAPFVLVRVIYTICSAFDHTSTTFSSRSDTTSAVIVRGIMAIAMEIVAAAIFLVAGILSPKMEQPSKLSSEHQLQEQAMIPKPHYESDTSYQRPSGSPPRY